MFKRIHTLFFLLLILPVAALADLTGVWRADDGGVYYLRQTGNHLSWYGEKSKTNPAWSNVFWAEIHGDSIDGRWVDVPKGHVMGRGILRLRITNNGNVLVVQHKTGDFGGSRWTRVGYNLAPTPAPSPMPQHPPTVINEDCVGFSTANAKVKHINGSWKIVDGSHWLFDFGGKKNEAIRSLQIIKRYSLNKSCFVGRPHPSFSYMKHNNQVPAGAMPGEDCIGFNTTHAEVQHINGSWKIVDGSHWLFDFGGKEGEARQALQIIKQQGCNNSCFVGRPQASFKYLRR